MIDLFFLLPPAIVYEASSFSRNGPARSAKRGMLVEFQLIPWMYSQGSAFVRGWSQFW